MGADADASSTRCIGVVPRRRSLSLDGTRWGRRAARTSFSPSRAASPRLFRRLFLERPASPPSTRRGLGFFRRSRAFWPIPSAFAACLARRASASIGSFYSKKPFGGPAQVLAYLRGATPPHRVAIANRPYPRPAMTIMSPLPGRTIRDGGAVKTMCFEARRVHPALPYSTPYPTASIAFATSDSSPMATERKSSPSVARLLTDGGEPTTRAGKIEFANIRAERKPSTLILRPVRKCGGVMRVIADLPRGGQRPRSEEGRFWCDTS